MIVTSLLHIISVGADTTVLQVNEMCSPEVAPSSPNGANAGPGVGVYSSSTPEVTMTGSGAGLADVTTALPAGATLIVGHAVTSGPPAGHGTVRVAGVSWLGATVTSC